MKIRSLLGINRWIRIKPDGTFPPGGPSGTAPTGGIAVKLASPRGSTLWPEARPPEADARYSGHRRLVQDLRCHGSCFVQAPGALPPRVETLQPLFRKQFRQPEIAPRFEPG